MVAQEREIGIRKILRRPGGSLQVIIPKREVAVPLHLKGDERVRVLLNRRRRRIIYDVIR